MMHPAYSWTDSSSYPHPNMIPSHMAPSPYQPWPYPVPHQYHHHHHPCPYYAPCPCTFHPPHFHPPPFPTPYSLPPQHYSVEQPQYEYDKHNHHCCGCNNHKADEKRPPIIKEEEEDDESQVDNKASDSHLPLLLKERPEYPIMWIPSGYMRNAESKEKGKDKRSHDPVSRKRLEPSKRGGNGEMAQDEKSGEGNQLPFKIFWLPSKNDQVGKDIKENNIDLKANQALPDGKIMGEIEGGLGSEEECETSTKHAAPKVFPVKHASTNEQAGGKHAVQKVIPVKQASANEEKKNLKSIDTMEKTDYNGSGASRKTSKLPPVCLRVDPLPKKKKSSRSPSPGGNERSNGSPVNTPNSSQQQAQVLKDEQSEGGFKTVEHADKVKHVNLADHADVPREKGDESDKVIAEEKKNVSEEVDGNENANVEKKKIMSEHEAALIIQSVYRGFEVRKSQPVKKLKQISEVKKQIFDLRNRIQDLETSSSSIGIDGKKQAIIGETIMSLLLKLDTIQGLHPFVREVRKSVAKELVGLQEKLDSLTSVKPEIPSEKTVGSHQQVMHLEDENHEHRDAKSQNDDSAEACSTPDVEQQLEESTEGDAIHDKFDQAPTESAAVICENHEVEATASQEGRNTASEPQSDSHVEQKDKALTECDEALGVCENHGVEATESHEGCNVVVEPQLGSRKEKLDEASAAECDEALVLHKENHEVEARESHEHCGEQLQLASHKEKPDQAASECNEALGLYENHEVEATESQEGCNTIGEPLQLESHKEKFQEKPTECDEAPKENHEVESTESQEGCNTSDVLQSESCIDQAPTERDEASGLHKENHQVEAKELHEGHNNNNNNTAAAAAAGESHKDKSDQAANECDSTLNEADLGLCENHEAEEATENDKKIEDNTGEHNKKQLDMPMVSEDLVKVGSDACEHHDKNVVECGDDGYVQTDNISSILVPEGKDEETRLGNEGGRLMAENEKLRATVEELMKAGKEQLGVIRELTGRVKDLEKKLSKNKNNKKKKNKVKVNQGRRTRDCVV